MTSEKLKALADILPTPSYVFDQDLFAERASLVSDAFGPKTKLCFSIKANPFLLSGLPDVFDKIEVCSPGELTICEKLDIDMSKIIFSGVNKTKRDVERAMADQVGTFTAESMRHLQLINDCAISYGKRIPLLLRLTGGSQFGMDESELLSIIRDRDQYPGVQIVGIHYFTGTQKRKAALIEKELSLLDDFVNKVEQEHGFRLEKVEYGTGLAVDYFAENPDEAEEARLAAIAPAIRALAEKVELTVEMGRFFAAPCGFHFTQVMDTKTCCGVHYAIVDGGLNMLKYDGQIQGMQIPRITHIGSAEEETEKWTLCGSLCTTADVLARNADFSGLKIGDTLVFHRTGAYSVMEGMAVFLSREMPTVALYSEENGLKVVRRKIDTDLFNTPVESKESLGEML